LCKALLLRWKEDALRERDGVSLFGAGLGGGSIEFFGAKSSSCHRREIDGDFGRACGSRVRANCLQDQRRIKIGRRLGADVLDAVSPIRAKIVIAQAIRLLVDDSFQPRFQ